MTDENTKTAALPSFNLIDEPWIPVLMQDGNSQVLSLKDTFAQAPNISQIVAELPTTSVAIEAVLQAILRRALPDYYPEDGQDPKQYREAVMDAVKEYWFDWDPVRGHVEDYLDEWADCFDLFDPKRPFFQVGNLEAAKGEPAGLAILMADVPSGHPFLTMRRAEGLDAIDFAEAARWVVHAQAYDPSGIRGAAVGDKRATGGRVYPIGPGWTARFGAFAPRTGSLAHDLLLSAAPSGIGHLSFDPEEDLPAWEREVATERPQGIGDQEWESLSVKQLRDLRRLPSGPSDVLTWQTRRIRLIAEDDKVTGVILANGDPLDPQNRQTVEPRAAWRYSKPQSTKFKIETYMPKEFTEGSSLWRGTESLFPQAVTTLRPNKQTEVVAFYGPAISDWIAHLGGSNALGRRELNGITFEVVGMVLGSNMSVVDDIITDSLTLPVALLQEENRQYRVEVEDWVQRAERVASAVGGFAADLQRAAGADNTDEVFAEAKGTFLANARIRFLETLSQLEVGDWAATENLGNHWTNELRKLAWQQRTDLLRDIGEAALQGSESGGRYVTAGSAEMFFGRRLAQILGTAPGKPTDQQTKEGTDA